LIPPEKPADRFKVRANTVSNCPRGRVVVREKYFASGLLTLMGVDHFTHSAAMEGSARGRRVRSYSLLAGQQARESRAAGGSRQRPRLGGRVEQLL